jgi:hypothetical protein
LTRKPELDTPAVFMTAMIMAHFLESAQNFGMCKPTRDGAYKGWKYRDETARPCEAAPRLS